MAGSRQRLLGMIGTANGDSVRDTMAKKRAIASKREAAITLARGAADAPMPPA